MLGLFALIAAQTGSMMPALPSSTPCRYDKAAMIGLDERAFDQDMAGGWRALADAGCDAEAADAVRDWREAHKSEKAILNWHEGQLRANAGQTSPAISLLERSRKTEAEDAGFGWNFYVEGTVAFLRKDRAALDTARNKLAALPRPAAAANLVGPDGKPRAMRWPPRNLNVLDSLRRCWGQRYKQAYACPAPTSG